MMQQGCLLFCAMFGAVVCTYELLLNPQTVSVIEYESVSLTCICNCTMPLELMVFQTEDGLEKSTISMATCKIDGQHDTHLGSFDCANDRTLRVTLHNVQRSKHMISYICNSFTSFNPSNQSIKSNTATIHVTIPVKGVVLQNKSGSTIATMENMQTVLVCITYDVYPKPEIIWFANSTTLHNVTNKVSIKQEATTQAYPQTYRSILTMYPQRLGNSTMISCKANNTLDGYSSDAAQLLVYFPPDTPSITMNSSPIYGGISVISGNSLKLMCSSKSYPAPQYQWSKGNKLLSHAEILRFPNVSHNEHTGNLTCRVTNTMPLYSADKSGQNVASIALNILYPPHSPYYLFNYTQQEIHDNKLYAVRGDTVAIRCKANSNPVSTYAWSGLAYYTGINTGTTASDTMITSISMDMWLSCTASNVMHGTNGDIKYGSSTSTVTVIVQYQPEHMQIEFNWAALTSSTAQVVEGTRVTIHCSATSVPSPYMYTLTREKQYETNTSPTGEFQITNVTRGQAGNYTMTAHNLMTPSFRNPINGTGEIFMNLDVLYGSSIRQFVVNGKRDNIVVNEHDTVTLTCKVDGNPLPDVAILYDNRVINQQSNGLTVQHMVLSITCYDMGTYECQSTNEYNKVLSTESLQITVTCSPRPNEDITLRSSFTSAMFVDKTISFDIYSYPVPKMKDFIWQRLDTDASTWVNLLDDNSTIISTSGLQTNISFINITQQIFGRYRFNVSNAFGSYTHEFVISPQDNPQPPTEFQNVDELATETSVTLSWKPGFDGGVEQIFLLDYRKFDSNTDWSTVTILDTGKQVINATLTFLASDSVYEFKLMATNDIGNSTTVGPLSVKTKELPTVDSFNGKLFTTVIVSGVVSFAVVSAVAIGILVRRTRKSKKKTNTSEESLTSSPNSRRSVLPNSAATSSSLEEIADTGIYENVLLSKSSMTDSNVVYSKKLTKNVKGTQPRTSLFFKTKKSKKGRKSSNRLTYIENSPVESFGLDPLEKRRHSEHDAIYQNESIHPTRVPVSSLYSYVINESYSTEFATLAKGLQFPVTVARKPENIALNRYNAIFAYDHSRVVLLNDPTFYMNACYIDGYRKRKAYIASLGPTEETSNKFETFWKMVWYENSDIIVMLTNLVEISGMKCEQYWPDVERSEKYGDVKVYCRSEEVYAEYTVRTFDISKNKVVRPLHHLHFTAWPDKSVPEDVSSLLEFRQRLEATFTTGHGPIVVHCSAGVGRTGTLIALNNLIEEGQREGYVDVLACVKRLREQRVYLVQTEQQYGFIYKSLVHVLEYETDVITQEEFQTYLEAKDDSFFDDMFERLKMNMESRSDTEVRLVHQSRAMLNRSGADIPGEMYRVRLYLDKEADDSDYINAVYLNSFKRKRYFITAQTPTHVTIEDFVRMLYQESCVCIISLGESETHGNVYKNEEVGLYLPPDNQTLTVGNFEVSSAKLETNPHYIVRRMKVKHTTKMFKAEKVSYHFQYIEWDVNNVCPNDPSEFANFVTDVDQYIASLGDNSGHVLVHCLDASERCGLFCSIATMIEKVTSEHRVNIGNIIRQVRSRRRTAIQNMKQLRFCHQAVNAYINMNK